MANEGQRGFFRDVEIDEGGIKISSSASRVPVYDLITSEVTIQDRVYDFSVSNTGESDGLLLGKTIKPGVSVGFDAGGLDNYYSPGTITIDGSGTELILAYNK